MYQQCYGLQCDFLQVLEKYYPWGPDMAEIFSRRAALFRAMGMFEATISDARAAVELDPNYSAVRLIVARCLFIFLR